MKTYIKNSRQWNGGRPAYVTTLNKGAGSSLDPPGYHSHSFGIVAGYDHGNGYQEYSSIDSYLESNWVPKYAKAQIKRLVSGCKQVNPPDKNWIYTVLGYFKNCFSENGVNCNSNDCLVWIPKRGCSYGDKFQHFKRDINKHLGVMFIRKFYPDYKPSISDFKNAYWGKK